MLVSIFNNAITYTVFESLANSSDNCHTIINMCYLFVVVSLFNVTIVYSFQCGDPSTFPVTTAGSLSRC